MPKTVSVSASPVLLLSTLMSVVALQACLPLEHPFFLPQLPTPPPPPPHPPLSSTFFEIGVEPDVGRAGRITSMSTLLRRGSCRTGQGWPAHSRSPCGAGAAQRAVPRAPPGRSCTRLRLFLRALARRCPTECSSLPPTPSPGTHHQVAMIAFYQTSCLGVNGQMSQPSCWSASASA